MKRSLSLSLFLVGLLASASAIAATGTRYRIDLRDGSHVFAVDIPVQRGSVVTFHQANGRGLTGLPAEEIIRIQAASASEVDAKVSARPQAARAIGAGRISAAQTLARPLQPGDILVLGPTGSGSAQAPGQNGNGSSGMANGSNSGYGANAGNGASGSTAAGAVPPGVAPNGQPFVPAPGDLARAPSGNPPTMDTNGFPTNGNPTTVNTSPNGAPVVAGSSQTAPSTTQPIGPNGFPATGTTAAQPGATQPTGPNGTPVLAPNGAPGAAPPVIGPNGTPVLAPPGGPGSNPPAVGPNGTPATGQPGTPGSAQPNTAPNGTPASPPPGGASPKG